MTQPEPNPYPKITAYEYRRNLDPRRIFDYLPGFKPNPAAPWHYRAVARLLLTDALYILYLWWSMLFCLTVCGLVIIAGVIDADRRDMPDWVYYPTVTGFAVLLFLAILRVIRWYTLRRLDYAPVPQATDGPDPAP